MLKRFLAPFLVLSLVVTVITVLGLNAEVLAQTSEANQDYFIKPIPTNKLVVVEPNYGHFYNPNPEIKGDASGQGLFRWFCTQKVEKDRITLWLSNFLDSNPKERFDKFLLP